MATENMNLLEVVEVLQGKRDMPTPRQKSKKKVVGQPTRVVGVDELREGDHIATVLVEGKYGAVLANKTQKVEEIDVCPHQWRTHIHVNKRDCYDTRTSVRVVR